MKLVRSLAAALLIAGTAAVPAQSIAQSASHASTKVERKDELFGIAVVPVLIAAVGAFVFVVSEITGEDDPASP